MSDEEIHGRKFISRRFQKSVFGIPISNEMYYKLIGQFYSALSSFSPGWGGGQGFGTLCMRFLLLQVKYDRKEFCFRVQFTKHSGLVTRMEFETPHGE